MADLNDLAALLPKLTWADMNNLASRIDEIATDDEGEKNGPHYIAGALLDWAEEISLATPRE